MPDFMDNLATARDYVSPQWTAAREVRVRVGIEHRRRSQARRRSVLAVAALSAAAAVAVFFALKLPTPAAPLAPIASALEVPKAAAPSNLFALPDGSSVSAGSDDARVQPVEVTPSAVTLKLESGSAKFSVAPDPARPFRVLARDVTVTVLGTVFDVSIERSGVRVSVERGRVRVDSSSASRELSPGESAFFGDGLAAPAKQPAAAAPAAALPVAPAGPSWRALAQDGDYSAALARLTSEGPSAVRDAPEDLLLAADVARLGGQPARAVAPLERVVTKHSGDSRAPLAAFTLGRTLLDQLGRPREAANAFASARKLAPSGALAQDALAREVESWSRAGETHKARSRAEEYLKLYPSGRRAASVRRLAGLDE
ncbi:MAG TPA: FecR domain-containing protein [Polyangiaceae bacterium]